MPTPKPAKPTKKSATWIKKTNPKKKTAKINKKQTVGGMRG
jgi:hypothetical protein